MVDWAVSSLGPVSKVIASVKQQFEHINIDNPSEQKLVDDTCVLIIQSLETMEPTEIVSVGASSIDGDVKISVRVCV